MDDVKLIAKITAKNNILLDLMQRHGIKNMSELAKKLGIKNISGLFNLKITSRKGAMINKVAKFFDVPVDYLLPNTLIEASQKMNGIKTSEERTVSSDDFLKILETKRQEQLLLSDPEEQCNITLMKEMTQEALNMLTEKERKVLELRFGINDGVTHTFRQVGAVMGFGPERARQYESKALKKLRHPARNRALKEFVE